MAALTTACASALPTPGGTLNLAAPCLPPGISEEFFFWPVITLRPLTLRTDVGGEVQGTWVVYARGDRAVAAVWADGHLLAVDPSPETDDPDWIDGALVIVNEDSFVLRANPGTSCLWQRNVEGVRV